MKIVSVEFVTSLQDVRDKPKQALPEVAFAGRSNVGKSSLINCLLNRKKLAKTSRTPGKTRLINYFKINDAFYFVDLPGYGFARVPRAEKARWQRMIESYFQESAELRGAVAIIDSRVGPTDLDIQLITWLHHLNVRPLVVATKADKLSKNALKQRLARYRKQLGEASGGEIYPFSSTSGFGKPELWKAVLKLLE